ncbi:MAG: GNAT family N-acetyltransferase [Myxococcales bacterium]|nr:GNAT family N-acetyltransferase [Myxococcales bacterium]
MAEARAEVRVRDAVASDRDRIVDYNLALARESEDKAIDRATLTSGVDRALASPALCRYFIAEIDAQPVGQTMITYELSDWRDGVLWWIQSVYVEPGARRKGVFRALYEHIEGLAREQGDVGGIRLYVERENARAMRTYEALGLRAAGYIVYEVDWSGAVS